MAMIRLRHDSGLTRDVKEGFSWTIFFFSWIALAFRGQMKEMWISLALIILTSWWSFGIPFFIYWIYLCIKGNELLFQSLLHNGYRVEDNPSDVVNITVE